MKTQLLQYFTFIMSLLLSFGCLRETSARMDRVPTGTRPMGMAGAFLTVGGDSNTISWNPATMPLVALDKALRFGTPEIFNTGQESQFTSDAFTNRRRLCGEDMTCSVSKTRLRFTP